jgi:hypothetical protein
MIVILSLLTILLGSAMIVESLIFQDSSVQEIKPPNLSTDFESSKTYTSLLFYLVVVLATIAIMIGICGLTCLAKPCSKSLGFIRIFGICITMSWLLFIVFGFIIVAVSTNGPETVQAFCDGEITDDQL